MKRLRHYTPLLAAADAPYHRYPVLRGRLDGINWRAYFAAQMLLGACFCNAVLSAVMIYAERYAGGRSIFGYTMQSFLLLPQLLVTWQTAHESHHNGLALSLFRTAQVSYNILHPQYYGACCVFKRSMAPTRRGACADCAWRALRDYQAASISCRWRSSARRRARRRCTAPSSPAPPSTCRSGSTWRSAARTRACEQRGTHARTHTRAHPPPPPPPLLAASDGCALARISCNKQTLSSIKKHA